MGVSRVEAGGQVDVDAVQVVKLGQVCLALELTDAGHRVVLAAAVLHLAAFSQTSVGH